MFGGKISAGWEPLPLRTVISIFSKNSRRCPRRYRYLSRKVCPSAGFIRNRATSFGVLQNQSGTAPTSSDDRIHDGVSTAHDPIRFEDTCRPAFFAETRQGSRKPISANILDSACLPRMLPATAGGKPKRVAARADANDLHARPTVE